MRCGIRRARGSIKDLKAHQIAVIIEVDDRAKFLLAAFGNGGVLQDNGKCVCLAVVRDSHCLAQYLSILLDLYAVTTTGGERSTSRKTQSAQFLGGFPTISSDWHTILERDRWSSCPGLAARAGSPLRRSDAALLRSPHEH